MIQHAEKVRTVTTRMGWGYRVIPGSFRVERDTDGTAFAVFDAYRKHGRGTDRVSILLSEIASVVEGDDR
jgi:hypothetical protein